MSSSPNTVPKAFGISLPSKIILHLAFVLYTILCIGPLLLVLAGSFSNESDILKYGFNFVPPEISLNAYRLILGNGSEVLKAYYYTILTTVIGTIVGLLLTASLAYPLSRKDFKYKNQFSFYVYFTMLFNGGMVTMYLVYTQLIPLRNTIFALIIPGLMGAFNVLLMRTFFAQNIPDAVVESAEIDGASVYRIFLMIVLPLSKPALATVALFSGMSYWNNFFFNMLFINDGRINNLPYLLYRITQQIQVINQNPELAMRLGGSLPDETARMAMVIVTIGPIIFLYPFLQKYFIKGLVVGAVKG
jgi:putative aldouronate transport system permease protein